MRLSTVILLMFLLPFLVRDYVPRWPPPQAVDCNAVVMHYDYGHHLVIEPKCRYI